MGLQYKLKGFHLTLLAVFALAPTAVLAEQDPVSQVPGQQQQDQAEATEAQAADTQAQAAAAPAETEEAQAEAAQIEAESVAAPATAAEGEDEEAQAQGDTGPKVISGMSILGNQEAPTSLVIVPWKSSEIGDSVGVSTILDDSRAPVDKEVFMRALSYYEIRSGTTP